MGIQPTTSSSKTAPYVWTHIRIHQMKPTRTTDARQEPSILKMSEYKGPVGNQDTLAVKKTDNS